MKRYDYVIQNSICKTLDLMIPVPDSFDVDIKYLCGCTQDEFITALKVAVSIVRNIFIAMIDNPSEFGFSLIPDIVNKKFDYKVNQSRNASRSLMSLLYVLGYSGELQDNTLHIDSTQFNKMVKSLKPKFKISHPMKLLKKLNDFGFNVNVKDFTIEYPDSPFVMNVLKGYSMAYDSSFAFYTFHYYLVADNYILPDDVFAEYIDESDRDFFKEFNRIMKYSGYTCTWDRSYEHTLSYFLNMNQPYIVRIMPYYRRLELKLRLKNITEYSEYINTLPPEIKSVFANDEHRNINYDVHEYIEIPLDDNTYYFPSYDYTFDIISPSVNDIPYYMEILKRETHF